MNNEDKKLEEVNSEVIENTASENENDKSAENIVQASEEIKENPDVQQNDKKDNTETDLGKVKLSHVLAYKIKKCNSKFKRAIAYILVGVICFCGGAFADRAFLKHRGINNFNRGTYTRGNMPNNFKGGRGFNNNFNNNNGNNGNNNNSNNNSNNSNNNNNNNNNNSSNGNYQ